jgi:fructokinase
MQIAAKRFFGAVEAGGTKFVCAIGDASGTILVEERFATRDPQSTLETLRACLHGQIAKIGPLAAIGVGSFGPIELQRRSPQYGHILQTPKSGWSGTDLVGVLAREFACPIGFDTDVTAAALAEHRWGAAQDVEDLVYVTVGTGIGAGALVDGRPLHGLMHPEMGHIHPRRHAEDAQFAGICPFHGDCLEGVASGPAIIARAGISLDQLDPSHSEWRIEADYLGQLCAHLVLTLSPQRIVMGGGVMTQTRLLPLIAARMQYWLKGYVNRPQLRDAVDRYIVAPQLGAVAGVSGALALALAASVAATRTDV